MAIQINGDSGISGVNGSAGTPALQGTDSNTGIVFGTDTVQISTGGTARATVDSSGRVGIGTTSPGSYASAADDLVVYNSGSAGITIRSGSSNDGSIYFNDTDDGNQRGIIRYVHGDDALAFHTPSGESMRIDSSGMVDFQTGIFGDNPTDNFTLNGRTQPHYGFNLVPETGVPVGFSGYRGIAFATNGSERLRIDSSGRLLVGGTSTSNTGLLCVKGNASSSTGAGQLTLQKGTGVTGADQELGAYNLGEGSASTAKIRAFTGANWTGSSRPTHLTFETTASGSSGPTERLRIDSSGNVGINNSSPGSYNSDGRNLVVGSGSGGQGLSIASGTSNYGTIYFADGTSGDALYRGAVLYNHGSDFMRFDTAAGERMRIDSSGNVGIGTTSMDGKLDIRGTTQIKHSNTNTSGLVSGLVLRQGSATNGNRLSLVFNSLDNHIVAGVNGVIETHSGSESSNQGRLEFYTKTSGSSVTERMRIGDDGYVATHMTSTSGLILGTVGNATNYTIIKGKSSSSGINSGNDVFYVYGNGNVQNSNNSYGQISDQKLKENIVDASSQWNNIKEVRVRNFNFIEGQTHTQIGVVAQELETVSPGLIDEAPDRDEDGNDLGTVTKSVKYSVLYMKAVKALQEAMTRIETLEARVTTLEAS